MIGRELICCGGGGDGRERALSMKLTVVAAVAECWDWYGVLILAFDRTRSEAKQMLRRATFCVGRNSSLFDELFCDAEARRSATATHTHTHSFIRGFASCVYRPYIHLIHNDRTPSAKRQNFVTSGPIFIFFHCYIQKGSTEEVGIKTTISPQICCHTILWKVSGPNSFTAQLIQFTVIKMLKYGKCSWGMLFLHFYTD